MKNIALKNTGFKAVFAHGLFFCLVQALMIQNLA